MMFNLQLDAPTLDLILEGLGHLPHNKVAKVIDRLRAGALEQAAAARKAAEAPAIPSAETPAPRKPRAAKAPPKE